MRLFESYLFDNNTPNLASIINSANIGLWEFDINTKKVRWSVGFYKMLGYEPGEIECSYLNFIDNLLYYQDKNTFLSAVNDRNASSSEGVVVRLLTKNGYEWFQSSSHKQAGIITGTIINVHQFKLSEFRLATNNILVTETNKMGKLGSWEFDVVTNKLFLSEEAFDIFELQAQDITVNELVCFFESEHRPAITTALDACIKNGRPFDLDLKLKTARDNFIWIKMKAVADIDHYGRCTSIKGIIQNIDLIKKSENELKSSLNLVNHQNKRLQNFAFIVSHNLRSYVSNLRFMVNLYESASHPKDQQEIFPNIKTISESLNTTIQHLNEIVKIDSEINQEKTKVEFDLLFKNIVSSLQSDIQSTNAIINYDFSKCPYVYYLPAYLESIFHNLLTNALKYRHPERKAIIKCESKKENDHIFIIFEDNGIGINLEKYGNKIFGMYQTFHKHKDSQGIGLYITRNQVEAMGGSISVESAVNVGTKFIIKLV